MSQLDPTVHAAVHAVLEPEEQLRAWAWGPADLPAEPSAIIGQIMVTLLGAFWRALLSPLQRLLAMLGVPVHSQVLGEQCWIAVTDRRVLAQPFTLRRRVLASGVSAEIELEDGGAMRAWPADAAPHASITTIRSTRILGFPDHPGLQLGYAPDVGDEKARRAVALRRELLGPER